MMKKLLSMLLIVCLLLSLGSVLVSCDEKDKGGEEASTDEGSLKSLSKEEWTAMSQSVSFDNVTFDISARIMEGMEWEEPVYHDTIKIAGDKILLEGEISTDPAEVQNVKNFYISCVTGLIENFEKFEYDEKTGLYLAKEAVSFPVSVAGMNATITATDLKIELNEAKQLAKATFIMDTVFTFSNYGTTVLE
jgi:hypothetical protein